MTNPELHHRRAPGNSCLSALHAPAIGSAERPLNDSKGCGTVMRAAPAGLIGANDPFQFGVEISALTHGHPSGYLAGGYLAALISDLVDGQPLEAAAQRRLDELQARENSDECARHVRRALEDARARPPSAAVVEDLGQGWVAEEALAIALYCAVVSATFIEGVRLAVNHSGDSDSTGAIAGNLLGAVLGLDALPQEWLKQLEMRDVITEVGEDLADARELREGSRALEWSRYPGY